MTKNGVGDDGKWKGRRDGRDRAVGLGGARAIARRLNRAQHLRPGTSFKVLSKKFGAEGGIRTHTGVYAQRFLRPPRLPFRHFGISG